MAVLNNNQLGGASGQASGYTLDNSLRFRKSASAYLSRTNSTSGTATTFTISAWVKRGELSTSYFYSWFGSQTGTNAFTFLGFDSSDKLVWRIRNSSSVDLTRMETTAVFRDPSAWYHIVLQFDSTESTALDRDKLWVNGEQITSFSSSNTTSLNGTPTGTTLTNPQIGRTNTNSSNNYYLDGYLADYNFIDGQALDPTNFGEYDEDTGAWIPKAYEGTYGTNGFYLDFEDTSSVAALGTDTSGNSNDFTPTNISLTSGATYDSMSDVPTLTDENTSNFCVLNPLQSTGQTSSFFIDNGNLDLSVTNNSAYRNVSATFSPEGLKGYFEILITGTPNFKAGFMNASRTNPNSADYTVSYANKGAVMLNQAGSTANGPSTVTSGYLSSFSTGDVIGCAFDFTNGARNIWWSKNNTWGTTAAGTGNPSDGSNPAFTNAVLTVPARFWFALNTGAGLQTISTNFGQRPFAYTPPTGFKKLNTFNLPDSTIVDGSTNFNTVTYTGDGTYPRTINGFEFQPDFVWFKARSSAYGHFLFDSIRGVGNTHFLASNLTNAEGVNSTNANIDSFDSDGYIIDTPSSTDTQNASGLTMVSWAWKAGGTAVSNTDGTITSSVSANPTAGFSIVTYTGTGVDGDTVGHGLSQAPELIFNKSRDAAQDWYVFGYPNNPTFTADGSNLKLNTSAALANSTVHEVSLDASVITFVDSGHPNLLNDNRVTYCFHSIEGYSKFGSYSGNGSTNGAFVYTGFKPKMVIIKTTSAAFHWVILDTERNPENLVHDVLYPSLTNAEANATTFASFDAVSNGFKLRNSHQYTNYNGYNYIYMAFAENPFKNSTAR